jgi:hypothetical protein
VQRARYRRSPDLGPVMEELGIELAQPPTIVPIVDLVQQ